MRVSHTHTTAATATRMAMHTRMGLGGRVRGPTAVGAALQQQQLGLSVQRLALLAPCK
jgi:hypothetical protein